ncbi:hypothetical protein Tco_0432134 [Tanacetum coccineum]
MCDIINEELSELIIVQVRIRAGPSIMMMMGTSIFNTSLETEKTCDEILVPSHRDISITSPKIDFLPEEFIEIDNDILQIEDEILRKKLLNVNLLIDKIEALNLTPSIPFEVDTFLVLEDSIPPGIESDLDSEGDNVFLDDLLYDDPISEYEHFTFDIKLDAPVIINFDELNEDECFDPEGGEIVVSQNIKDDDSFKFVIAQTVLFSRFSLTLWILLYFSPLGVKTPFLTLASPLRAGGILSGWNFHVSFIEELGQNQSKNDKTGHANEKKSTRAGSL